MAEFLENKCKNCGAELDLRNAVSGVVECGYCHTPWTVPKQETVPEAMKYLHDGNAALDVCKFEDGFTYFQKASELDKNEPEAYFGMALAQFKVQYLKDEVNDCLQPICHEISEKVFTEDKNYKKALEFATVEQKKVYRRKGGEIDDIRDEFFALQKSGLTYDSFICVKVTEGDGRTHTEDYNRANDIYYHLKDNGYRPFYSEREMRGRTGSAYEALILYALYTSECMLIVCSDEDYLQTKWVKNEYTRFINLMQEGGKERDALTFVFAGKPIEKLPMGKKIQGIDLTKPDAYSHITEYVERHTPDATERKYISSGSGLSDSDLLAALKRVQEEEKKRKEEEENSEENKIKKKFSSCPHLLEVYYSAKNGDVSALEQLGEAYFLGLELKQNYEEAIRWLMVAAQKNSAYACWLLGEIYEAGDEEHEIEQDLEKAFDYYRQAADGKYPEAYFSLASCYENGKGVKKNLTKARELYRLAADSGVRMS